VIVERIKDTRYPFHRPPLPQQETEEVHPGILTLMKQCWTEEPAERPSFNDIAKTLKTINKGKSVNRSVLSCVPVTCKVLSVRNINIKRKTTLTHKMFRCALLQSVASRFLNA